MSMSMDKLHDLINEQAARIMKLEQQLREKTTVLSFVKESLNAAQDRLDTLSDYEAYVDPYAAHGSGRNGRGWVRLDTLCEEAWTGKHDEAGDTFHLRHVEPKRNASHENEPDRED